ncbi:MAG: ATP-binding protein, partial [Gammaproteobacteria bacterium]|nr:ATP-binding protein [Gammaproteobacteria bacterium]
MTDAEPSADQGRVLRLNYCGRIIDHLGLQMYQSPVAAVAELVANAWDADADNVKITLPSNLTKAAELTVEDDGNGMSFAECQARFLNVGYARRGNKNIERSKEKKRRILGRKGIGKFAGFGIARLVRIETVSKVNGERTVFEMDISKLRADKYVNR